MGLGINWAGLILLALSPHIALLAQLGLSRVREFDADRMAAELTGDPRGLASALARIEGVSRSWRQIFFPGWGNPEPSWLRTHPATVERIRRLLEQSGTASGDPHDALWPSHPSPPPRLANPRWRAGGHWW